VNILLILIPLSMVLVAAACAAFFWAVDAGQFDDLDSPGWDVLTDSSQRDAGEIHTPIGRQR
jgi:cbb3-type cytochrome oxidase maturation protein